MILQEYKEKTVEEEKQRKQQEHEQILGSMVEEEKRFRAYTDMCLDEW